MIRSVHLVTGGGRGIGRAVVAHLLRAGDAVAILDLGCNVDGSGTNEAVARSAADELGGAVLAFDTDVRDAAAVEAAIQETVERWGRLDGVCNAAAVLRTGNVLTATDEDWNTTLDVNLTGAMNVARAAIRHWVSAEHGGRLVNVTSTAGLEGIPEMFAYSVAKAGVIGLTMAAANAVACRGIVVNAIAPLAATRMAVRGLGDDALRAREQTGAWPDIASGRLDPQHVAPLVEYLLSPGIAVTGRIFTVGGGAAARLGAPIVESTMEFDWRVASDQLTTEFDTTVGVPAAASRWQLATLPLERPAFPVEELD